MTTTAGRRFWVEMLPRFAAPAQPPPDVAGRPRLTALAVAAGLDGAELDAELASVHGQRSALAAYELGLIERKAALGARQPLPFGSVARTDTCPDGAVPDLLDEEAALQAADDFLPEEVAVLFGASVPSIRHHVDYALTLVRQLPAAWHALADQRIDESRARAIVEALKHQAASWGGPVADDIIAALAGCGVGWAERGCGPSALKKRLLGALIAAEPAAADRRREKAEQRADAVVTSTGDGLGEWRLTHVDITDLQQAKAQVNSYAKKLKADGDQRPIGQIRIAVILSLILRPWEARDPAVAHVTINADLADLMLPDLDDLGDLVADTEDEPSDPAADDGAADDLATDGEAAVGEAAVDDHGVDGRLTDSESAAEHLAADDGACGDGGPAHGGGGDPRSGGGADGGGQSTVYGTGLPGPLGTGMPAGGSQVGHVDGSPISPTAVRELLRRIDALALTNPDGGHLAFTITGPGRRLLAVATPEELIAAAKAGRGLGPPPATADYRPTAAQYRYLRARDRHCRFPGCRHTALHTDADHVDPYNHRNPSRGGQTCVRNLVMLCRRHHRLKTHAHGWRFRLDDDGTLHVTTPGGTTRTTKPPAADEILDLLTDPEPPPHDPAADPPPF